MHISEVLYRVESFFSSFHQAHCVLHQSVVLVFMFFGLKPLYHKSKCSSKTSALCYISETLPLYLVDFAS